MAAGTRKPGRRDRGGDIRGLITVMVLLLTYGLAFAQLLLGAEDGATIPPWAAQLAGVVVTGYFMTEGARRHADALTRARGRREDAATVSPPDEPQP